MRGRAAVLSFVLMYSVCKAGELAGETAPDFARYELRLGTFAHDSLSPERGGIDVNGEILVAPFAAPSAFVPRLHAGATVSTSGKTSSAYAGLSWTFDLTRTVFAEVSFGGALNNGSVGPTPIAGHNAMGCHASFRESFSLGYRLTQTLSIMASIEHLSNAGLCAQNRGLTNAGVRAAWRF